MQELAPPQMIRKTVTITPELMEMVLSFRALLLSSNIDADFTNGLGILTDFGFNQLRRIATPEDLVSSIERRISIDESSRAKLLKSIPGWQASLTPVSESGGLRKTVAIPGHETGKGRQVAEVRGTPITRFCFTCKQVRPMNPVEVRGGKKGTKALYGTCSVCGKPMASNTLADIVRFEGSTRTGPSRRSG